MGQEDCGRVGRGTQRIFPTREVSEITHLASPFSEQRKLIPLCGKPRPIREETPGPLYPHHFLHLPKVMGRRKGKETR